MHKLQDVTRGEGVKKTIMWASDSSFIPTGFSNQSNYICRALSQFYNILYWSHQYAGMEAVQVTKQGETPEPWVHLPSHVGSYGQGILEQQIRRFQPKLITWLCDSFMLTQAQPHSGPRNDWAIKMIENIRKDNLDVRFMHYYPLDSADIYQGVEEELRAMDYRVAMSRFARDLVKNETGLDSHYIPHACDTNIFFPLAQEEKDKIRAKSGLKDKFVIGSVGRNQSRKMPYRLAYVAKEFCEDKHDIVFLLHCDPFDPQAGVNTKEVITNATPFTYSKYFQLLKQKTKNAGFSEKSTFVHEDKNGNQIIFTGVNWTVGYPTNVVNEIYNTCDVHCMPTTGEGFGITTIEAMAAGIPNVTTDYTTANELLIQDGECGIPTEWDNFINGGLNTKRVLVDHVAFANALEKYYNSDKLRKQHGEKGRHKAVELYSLQAVLPQWTKLYSEVLGKEKEEIRCVV